MTDAQLRDVADEITEWRRAGIFLTTARIDRLCAAVEELIRRDLKRPALEAMSVEQADAYFVRAMKNPWWRAVDAR